MDQELLKQAQRGLRIRDVFQVAAHAKVAKEYDYSPFPENQGPVLQTKHLVRQTVVLEPVDGEDAPNMFRVHIELGVRWKRSVDAPDENEDSWTEIGATYVAEYEIDQEVEADALTAFALHNASFHVWPYFREFVASQCQRMNFPKIVIPMMRFASNRDASNSPTAQQKHTES